MFSLFDVYKLLTRLLCQGGYTVNMHVVPGLSANYAACLLPPPAPFSGAHVRVA